MGYQTQTRANIFMFVPINQHTRQFFGNSKEKLEKFNLYFFRHLFSTHFYCSFTFYFFNFFLIHFVLHSNTFLLSCDDPFLVIVW